MRGRLLALLLLLIAATAACTGSGPPEGSTDGSTPAPTDVSSVRLPCNQSIQSIAQPPPDLEVVLDVVALPTSDIAPAALQTSTSGDRDPAARLFAKAGLLVKAGTSFELSVLDDATDRASIGWGSPAQRTQRLVVDPCPGAPAWLAFAGGYWVRDPGCVPVVVKAGNEERTVTIGVGGPCPGQGAPPQPSAT